MKPPPDAQVVEEVALEAPPKSADTAGTPYDPSVTQPDAAVSRAIRRTGPAVSGSALTLMLLNLITHARPLREILDTICQEVEQRLPDTRCTVLLVDADCRHLHTGGYGNVPSSYMAALEGLEIGPETGTCGSAIFHCCMMVTEDIHTDPRWEGFRHLADSVGFRACWSAPILARTKQCLGSFAMYRMQPGMPLRSEIEVVTQAAYVTALAIEDHHTREALIRSEERLQLALEASDLGTWDWDPATHQLILEPHSRSSDPNRLTQLRSVPALLTYIPKDDLPSLKSASEQMLSGQLQALHVRFRISLIQGRERWIQANGRVMLRDQDGKPTRVLGTFEDITEEQRAAAQLHLFSDVVEHTAEGMLVIGPAQEIQWANAAASSITGYPLFALLGRPLSVLFTDVQDNAHERQLTLAEEGTWQGEVKGLRHDGGLYPLLMNITRLPEGRHPNAEYVVCLTDLSRQKQDEARIRHLVSHDGLTDLPNRMLALERLPYAMARTRRDHANLAVLLIDLDHFQRINDTLSHEEGDALLRAVARLLGGCIRETDMVARMGGDEFLILLEGLENPFGSVEVTQRILQRLSRPILLGRHELLTTASIGISLFPFDAQQPDELIRHADIALHQAKAAGRNTWRFFSPGMHAFSTEHLRMEGQLALALERGEFLLHYQPRIDLRSARVVGVEALIRWQHPERGLVSPARFIPSAEEFGLIIPIGEWALRTACLQVHAWMEAGLPPVRVAVNLSAIQFREAGLKERIERILHETSMDPDLLELEVVESSVMADAEESIRLLHSLKELGIHLSIDDFGTGYSSLARLKRFPINALKIDRSFIMDIETDTNDATIVQAVIGLGHSLNFRVVAEGVENQEQLRFLQQRDCDEVQGYLFSRPVPPSECEVLIRQTRLDLGAF